MHKTTAEKSIPEEYPERRAVPRRRVLLGGVLTDGKSSIDCTIRDISVKGAQVELSKKMHVDKQLYLVDTHRLLREMFCPLPRRRTLHAPKTSHDAVILEQVTIFPGNVFDLDRRHERRRGKVRLHRGKTCFDPLHR